MKSIFFFAILSVLLSSSDFAQAQLPVDLKLYLRAGTGANGAGGVQECVSNKGTGGNEFRLGNECGIYGEFGFGVWMLKAERDGDPSWRFFSNFAVVAPNQKDWEAPNANNWVMREVYSEAANLGGSHFSAWVGKRFYRWGDIHMMDFYPVSMSGPGAGLGDLQSDWGTWSLALMQNRAPAADVPGSPAKTSFHLRSDGIPSSWGAWSLWAVLASSPGGVSEASGGNPSTSFKKSGGAFLAVRNNSVLVPGVNNEFAVAFGQGTMSNMGVESSLVKDCSVPTDPDCFVAESRRVRAWNSLHWERERWSGQAVVLFDESDNGSAQNSKVRWTSIGVRPMYWFNDHLSLSFQAGLSNVLDESDGFGARNLMRFTLAPQWSMGKGFYSRPVLRAYLSRTQWSDNNKISAAGTSAANSTALDSFGFQTEIWF